MSKYNDYNVTSATYDSSRRPAGSDVIAGLMQVYGGKKLQDLRVLDAGCGTGNYSKDLLEMGVGHITLYDASEGMLDVAKSKLDSYKGAVTIKQGILPELPFEDGTFDVVMFNFVLHHLVTGGAEDPYQTMAQALVEASRVLAVGGLLVLGTVLPEQLRESLWYAALSPSLSLKGSKKLVPISTLKNMIKAAQLNFKRAVTVLGSDWFDQYEDLEGPLKPEWRKNVSLWSMATDAELKEVEDKVKQLKEDGKLEEFFKEHNKIDYAGFFMFAFARKE